MKSFNVSKSNENPQRILRILKIIEETCVHRNTVRAMGAPTGAILSWGFSLQFDTRDGKWRDNGWLGFKYSFSIIESMWSPAKRTHPTRPPNSCMAFQSLPPRLANSCQLSRKQVHHRCEKGNFVVTLFHLCLVLSVSVGRNLHRQVASKNLSSRLKKPKQSPQKRREEKGQRKRKKEEEGEEEEEEENEKRKGRRERERQREKKEQASRGCWQRGSQYSTKKSF